MATSETGSAELADGRGAEVGVPAPDDGSGARGRRHGEDDEHDQRSRRRRIGQRRAAAERAIDRVRGKFGHEAMVKGLEFDREED